MALVLNDRVKETSTTTGVGAMALGGAATGFETFAAGIGNSNTTYYAIWNQGTYEWLLTHAYGLCEEYFLRYGKIHKSLDAIDWCDNNSHKLGSCEDWIASITCIYKLQICFRRIK